MENYDDRNDVDESDDDDRNKDVSDDDKNEDGSDDAKNECENDDDRNEGGESDSDSDDSHEDGFMNFLFAQEVLHTARGEPELNEETNVLADPVLPGPAEDDRAVERRELEVRVNQFVADARTADYQQEEVAGVPNPTEEEDGDFLSLLDRFRPDIPPPEPDLQREEDSDGWNMGAGRLSFVSSQCWRKFRMNRRKSG